MKYLTTKNFSLEKEYTDDAPRSKIKAERGIQVGNNIYVVSAQSNSAPDEKVSTQIDLHETISSFSICDGTEADALADICESFS